MKKAVFFIVIIALFLYFFVRVKEPHIPTYYEIIKDKTNIPIVKVLIYENLQSIDISIEGEFLILNSKNEVVKNIKNGVKKAQIIYEEKEGSFVVTTPTIYDILKNKEIRISSVVGNPIKLNDRYYLGELIFYQLKANTFFIVNQLDLETYLLGVLPGETVDTFNLEAIKAQAIASRTYALSEIQTSKNTKWHIKNTTKSQVFVGTSAVNEKFNKAVIETRGIIMIDKDRPFRAYFSSSCGGATANLSSMPWEKEKSMIMVGRPCDYCNKMKPTNFNWVAKFSKSTIQKALQDYGLKEITTIADIKILKQDSFGRVLELEIIDDNKKQYVLNALRFRNEVVKESFKLRSCLFTISMDAQNVTFNGVGWGHGVGLCQYGSQGMALEGKSFSDILKFYYDNVPFYKFY